MSLDGRFRGRETRRPKVGSRCSRLLERPVQRDGGRMSGAPLAFAARSGLAEDKSEIKNEVRADVRGRPGRRNNPQAHGHLMFTNVESDGRGRGERSGEKIGREAGLTFVDIVYRERTAHPFDAPRGFALRFQYSGCSPSLLKQLGNRWGKRGGRPRGTFFNECGRTDTGVHAARFDTVDRGAPTTRVPQESECCRCRHTPSRSGSTA